MTCCPGVSDRRLPTMRPSTSVPPPGGNGTTMVTRRSGSPAAEAGCQGGGQFVGGANGGQQAGEQIRRMGGLRSWLSLMIPMSGSVDMNQSRQPTRAPILSCAIRAKLPFMSLAAEAGITFARRRKAASATGRARRCGRCSTLPFPDLLFRAPAVHRAHFDPTECRSPRCCRSRPAAARRTAPIARRARTTTPASRRKS